MRVVHELFLPQPGVQHKAINKSEKVTIKVVTQANPKVYSNLGLKPGTPLAYLERLFTRKKRVVGINCAWFPLSLVPDIVNDGLLENSISRTLQEKYHLNFDSVENYIEAIMLDAQTAQQFDIVSPSPALRITSVYTLSSGKPVEYSVTIWNGRDTQFHVMISSQ
jgi:DNA-binding GntR family transcriptional regulator